MRFFSLLFGLLFILTGMNFLITKQVHFYRYNTNYYGQDAIILGWICILFGGGWIYTLLKNKRKQ